MLKRANINWNARQYVKMIEKGSIGFDNAVQRGYTWDNDRKSLLIHSMVTGFPIPAFYATKEEGKYSMLDGKQRSNAIYSFVKDEFKLQNIPEITTEDETTTDINGLTFSELPEDIQDTIRGYSLTVYYFEDITEDEVAEMFYRLNNGKPLSSIELTRVKAKSFDKIKDVASHPIFRENLSDSALRRFTNEDLVIKSWIILFDESADRSLETKYIRKFVKENELTDNHIEGIRSVYERIMNIKAYCEMKIQATEEKEKAKAIKSVMKKMFKSIHFVSIIPVIHKSIQEGKSDSDTANFLLQFFNSDEAASIDEDYNDSCTSGTAKTENVNMRLQMLIDHYEEYFEDDEPEKESA